MTTGLLVRLRERGVLRVAAGYAVIAWLLLQIADVTFEPLGVPTWGMTSLIVAAVLGFPVAIALAWFYEIGDQGVQRDTAAAGVVRPSVHGKRRYADLAIIGVLLVAVAVLLVRQSDIGKPAPPASPAIAVLPFDNLSGDPGQDYFSDGLAIEVLDRLGRVPGLRVIASSSSFSFRGKQQDVKTIAEQLGVTTVLEGSVRRDGAKLKVNAKLIDGSTGFQLWSGSFDRDVTDIFAVQAELAAAVIDAIVPAARGDTVATVVPTTSLDAHDHYLLGLAAQRSRSVARLAESVTHLEQAVTLDPSYAQAHAALANSLLLWGGYSGVLGTAGPGDPLTRAEQSVYKALGLDASLSDAHGALGNLLRLQERPGAEDAYKRALELNPNNAIVTHNYAVLLSDQPGREADNLAMSERTLQLDPRSAIAWTNNLERVYRTQGAAEYRQQFERAMAVFNGDPDGLGALGLAAKDEFPYESYQLSVALERAGGDRATALLISLGPLIAVGEYDEALARIDQISALGPIDPRMLRPHRILAWGLKGDFASLNELFADPTPLNVPPHFRYAVNAFWFSVQGRFDDASAALARAGHVVEFGGGPMGSSMEHGAVPALMRLYSATGRAGEAKEIAVRFREALRGKQEGQPPLAAHDVVLAGIAAASGDRAAAVRHLQQAMERVQLPALFYPQLPWFKSLEGEPGYAQIVDELERRRAAIRLQIASLR
jgi:TolB-like protein/tetratricopeptide (TPR) repeat protein